MIRTIHNEGGLPDGKKHKQASTHLKRMRMTVLQLQETKRYIKHSKIAVPAHLFGSEFSYVSFHLLPLRFKSTSGI